MTVISYRNGVSIAEIVFYVPALAIAILLAIRHGFGRSSGWMFLIIFALARIIGPCFDLATISDPRNTSLYIGSSILQSIGLSPLELTTLGLLSRVISSINKSQPTLITPLHMKTIQTIVTVGLILGIIGGISASDELAKGEPYTPQTLSKVSVGLFLGAYVLLVASTIVISFSISHAEHGEKRLLIAVALSLPFLLVRVIFSAISTFANISNFNLLTGSVTILLCMALIMEAAVVIIYEGVGLMLRKVPTYDQPTAVGEQLGSNSAGEPYSSKPTNQEDMEMQQGYGGRREQRRERRWGRRQGRY